MLRYFIFFLVFIFIACAKNTKSEYYSFDNKTWNSDSIVLFKYVISDTTKKYDLLLKIRHTVDYEFQNLFLFLDNGTKDTVEIILSNKKGKWFGSGVIDVREIEYVIAKNTLFSKKGEYYLRVEQAMRYGPVEKIRNLEHILDVGLIVRRSNE